MRKVFIFSDLHLGGPPDRTDENGNPVTGLQICHSYAELVHFVRWVGSQADEDAPGDVELVVNGDIVDFLAEHDPRGPSGKAKTFVMDEDQVIAKLDQIVERTRVVDGEGVFDAMRKFLDDGHRLTFLLGNHDVELSLPKVRRHLEDRLLRSEGKLFRFLYDGEAYALGRLLIEHGNRYDSWNQVNHSRLRQERSAMSRRDAVPEGLRDELLFVAPPGTHLVIHFLNPIKNRYRFTDLLKPEDSTVVPLLLALEPGVAPELESMLKVKDIFAALSGKGMRSATVPKVSGDMAAGDDLAPGSSVEEVGLQDFLKDAFGEEEAKVLLPEAPGRTGDMGFDGVYKAKDWLVAQATWIGEGVGSLTRWVGIKNAADEEERLERLHLALQKVSKSDRAFDPKTEQKAYVDAATEFCKKGDFQVVVFGHTHIQKDVVLQGEGSPRYLNSGTWVDVMQLPEEIDQDGEVGRACVKEFLEAVRENDFSRYVQRYLGFAEVHVDLDSPEGGVEFAAVHSYCGEGKERSDPMTSVLT